MTQVDDIDKQTIDVNSNQIDKFNNLNSSIETTNLKNEYIFNIIHSYDQFNLCFSNNDDYSDDGIPLDAELLLFQLILPTCSLVDSVKKIDSLRLVEFLDIINDDTFLMCQKRTFGKWNIRLTGTANRLKELTGVILAKQLKYNCNVIVEVSKFQLQIIRCEAVIDVNDSPITVDIDRYLINIPFNDRNVEKLIFQLVHIGKYEKLANAINSPRYCALESLNGLDVPIVLSSKRGDSPKQLETLVELTKPDVSFLLGRNGERITSIRNQTNCKIFIMPIASKSGLLANRRTPQTIKLIGEKEEVELALKLINVNLSLYRENKVNFL